MLWVWLLLLLADVCKVYNLIYSCFADVKLAETQQQASGCFHANNFLVAGSSSLVVVYTLEFAVPRLERIAHCSLSIGLL